MHVHDFSYCYGFLLDLFSKLPDWTNIAVKLKADTDRTRLHTRRDFFVFKSKQNRQGKEIL